MQEGRMNGEGTAQGTIGHTLASIEERLGPQLEQVRNTLETLNAKAQRALRENPGVALVAAVGVGFLIGRLVSRR